ncbi:MAG: hypothetical protein ABL901_06355 [Hyphomicrobiaceae bacterium]
MSMFRRYPGLAMAALAFVSGLLGTFAEGPGFGTAPQLGVYLVLAGVWFGLVVAFGAWNWGEQRWTGALIAFVATWVAWELAVNTALQIDAYWTRGGHNPGWLGLYLAGFVAGAIGAGVTWAGAAVSLPLLRRVHVGAGMIGVGATMGLLLPYTNHYDNGAILLIPWQVAVAAWLGRGVKTLGSKHFAASKHLAARMT